MEMPARANQLNKTPHMLLKDQVISAETQIRKVWICHLGKYKSLCTCCQLQARNKLVVLNPGCPLESPKELIKNTNAQAPPRTNKIRIFGNGTQASVYIYFNSLGNFYEQRELRTTALREAYSKQSHIGGRLLRGSELGLFLYLLKFGTKGKWSLVSSSMDAPGPSQGGPSHWSQL